jgi:formylglycine-generating enzyme required for sulfatase activity
MGRPYTDEGDPDELPVHTVTLSAYRIGLYPITNQEFADLLTWAQLRGYLEDNGGAPYTGGAVYAYGRFLADTTDSAGSSQIVYQNGVFRVRSRVGYGGAQYSMADHPVVHVSWHGAACYCNWLSEHQQMEPCYDTVTWNLHVPLRYGYRLPTEAEWERAAAWDGGRHWRYGIAGDELNTRQANYYTTTFTNPLGLTEEPYTSPVGWYNGGNAAQLIAPALLTLDSPSPAGCYDMAGNVWEWCHDWYGAYPSESASNPLGAASGSSRILRGGSWFNTYWISRAAARGSDAPENRDQDYGFRIASSIPQE